MSVVAHDEAQLTERLMAADVFTIRRVAPFPFAPRHKSPREDRDGSITTFTAGLYLARASVELRLRCILAFKLYICSVNGPRTGGARNA